MRTNLGLQLLALSGTLSFVLGCSSSSDRGGEEPPRRANLLVESLAVTTPPAEIHAGHRLTAQVTLRADLETQAVGVVYRIVAKGPWDARAASGANWVVGGSAHDLPPDAATFEVSLQIPPTSLRATTTSSRRWIRSGESPSPTSRIS